MFGAIQSPPDPRDYIYSALVGAVTLPSLFNLNMTPIRDQGRFGTCVAFASSGVKDYQESRNYPGRNYQVSPLFVYSECKRADGIPNTEGTYPRVAMAILKDKGVCKEQSLPYDKMTNPVPSVPAPAYSEAKEFRIGAYAKISTVNEIKQAIYQDGPVLGALLVAENFMRPENGFIDLPAGKVLGGHAIVLCGWNDNMVVTYRNGVTRKGFFKLRNSWGTDWGNDGYAWLPYDFVTFRDDVGMPYFMEAWSSVDIVLPPPQAKEITLWVDKQIAVIDGVEVKLDQAPILSAIGRTLVPLRFIAETLGYAVDWDAKSKKITLTKPEVTL